MSDPETEQRKTVFLYTVIGGWFLVVLASLYSFLFKDGPLPDPILLSVPTSVWLAMYPPLPSSLREEQKNAK